MEPKSYAMLLAEYGRRFSDIPPSILSEEGAIELMIRALTRGSPIMGADLSNQFGHRALSPAA
jgi:hypothetical protein